MLLLPSTAFGNGAAYDLAIARASEHYHVPKNLIRAIIATESGFDCQATNPRSSAWGLMQVTRAAAKDMNYEYSGLSDPSTNILAGTAYLAAQIKAFGYMGGIMAYHIGPGNYRRERNMSAGRKYFRRVFDYLLAYNS